MSAGREPVRIRLEWGRRGAALAAGRGDVVAVVDVLSFSTTVATAVAAGALVHPVRMRGEEARAAAHALDAELAVARGSTEGRYTLSPRSFVEVEAGVRVVLPSPNGATCSGILADGAAAVFAGALVNRTATARAILARLQAAAGTTRDGPVTTGVTVLACGERWRDGLASDTHGETMRVALEDYLGAGAILDALSTVTDAGDGIDWRFTPDALVCRDSFRASEAEVARRIVDCESGQELVELGFGPDVDHAVEIDSLDLAALLVDGWYQAPV